MREQKLLFDAVGGLKKIKGEISNPYYLRCGLIAESSAGRYQHNSIVEGFKSIKKVQSTPENE